MTSSGAAHRRGRRSVLIDQPKRRRAPLVDLIAAAADPAIAKRVGREVSIELATIAGQRAVSVTELRHVDPLELLPTRRPASFREMRAFVGRASVPHGEATGSVWFESLNELAHIRDVLITTSVTVFVTQPMLLTWTLEHGVRRHFPDLLYVTDRGVTLSDVTRSNKLVKPEALAQFVLTAATAHAAGWDYEVRTELPPQRVRTVAHIHACRHAPSSDTERWLRAIPSRELPAQIHTLTARRAGVLTVSGLLHLVAHRRVFLDLNESISPASYIYPHPIEKEVPAWIHRLG